MSGDKVAEPSWHGATFLLSPSPSASAFMSKNVQVADILTCLKGT